MLQVKEEHAQHQKVISCLKDAGPVYMLMFSCSISFHLKHLGIAGDPMRLLMEKLHFRALKQLEQLVGTCRRLEDSDAEPNIRKRKRNE